MSSHVLSTMDVEKLIAAGESLSVEFKSEKRKKLSDKDIYANVVCLANSDGGTLLLGVEDSGDVTGADLRHSGSIDPIRLQTAVFNNTVPSINSRVSVHQIQSHPVVAIDVDAVPEICATKDGRCIRRVMGANGPECRPYYPHEHTGRRSDLGLIDYTAQLADGLDWNDLDPLEFERLRQTITQRRGEQALLSLNDRELAQALQTR